MSGGTLTERRATRRAASRALAATLAVLLGAVVAVEARHVLGTYVDLGILGMDLEIYLERSRDWLAGDGFYRDRQLNGAYDVQVGDALYPPPVLVLFLPFLVLPRILWWAVPVGIVVYALVRHRPSPWVWVAILGCLAWTPSLYTIAYGNPTIWLVAAIAAATVWRWPAVFLALKPTLAPFVLVGVTARSFWVAAGVLALGSLALLPMWLEYVAVIRDSNLDWAYSVWDIPLSAIPMLAWVRRWPERRRWPALLSRPPARAAGPVRPPETGIRTSGAGGSTPAAADRP